MSSKSVDLSQLCDHDRRELESFQNFLKLRGQFRDAVSMYGKDSPAALKLKDRFAKAIESFSSVPDEPLKELAQIPVYTYRCSTPNGDIFLPSFRKTDANGGRIAGFIEGIGIHLVEQGGTTRLVVPSLGMDGEDALACGEAVNYASLRLHGLTLRNLS